MIDEDPNTMGDPALQEDDVGKVDENSDEDDPTLQQHNEDEGGIVDEEPDSDDHALQEEDGGDIDGAAVLLQDEDGRVLMQMEGEEDLVLQDDDDDVGIFIRTDLGEDPDTIGNPALQEEDGAAVLLQDEEGDVGRLLMQMIDEEPGKDQQDTGGTSDEDPDEDDHALQQDEGDGRVFMQMEGEDDLVLQDDVSVKLKV